MAWNTPATMVAGQLVVASFWNAQNRDNKAALRAGGMAIASQAAGDFIYAGSSTQWARLAGVEGRIAYRTGGAWSTTSLLDLIYPIGTVYRSVVSTNPASIVGGGTWTAFAVGRALLGIDTGQTEFDTVEETGGAKTVTLTTTEMPAHSHTVTDPGHVHLFGHRSDNSGPDAGVRMIDNYPGTDGSVTTSTNTTGVTIQSTGSGVAHNNLNPYIALYCWKRTA